MGRRRLRQDARIARQTERGTLDIQFAWLIAAVIFLGAAVMQLRATHDPAAPAAH